MGVYSIGIVGESFRNPDGRSRQAEIKRCAVGERVSFEREPDNPHDPACVKVLSARGVQIGNISRDHPWICERIDGGRFVDAKIQSIGQAENGLHGVTIQLRTAESDEWPRSGCALWAVLLLAGAIVATIGGKVAAHPTVADDIRVYCAGRSACVAEQIADARYFVGRMVMYEVPHPVAEGCMRRGKVGRHIDWTVAFACIRNWTKGRDTIIARKLKEP